MLLNLSVILQNSVPLISQEFGLFWVDGQLVVETQAEVKFHIFHHLFWISILKVKDVHLDFLAVDFQIDDLDDLQIKLQAAEITGATVKHEIISNGPRG